ncbi:MAG: ZPR1 zinc finger domain-containing protein [Candidatus Thermoplasmatota archaeon]
MVRAFIDEAVCPACAAIGMEYTAEEVDLPFLGNSLETMLRCEPCGYRHTDFILTGSHEPTRHTLRVATAEHMSTRVVRSSSGTIRIPELGILIEPGVASEAFISNVEGILVRVERVLGQILRDADSDEERLRIVELQQTMERMREGQAEPVTLILEDPFGNSSILGAGATAETMTPEEAEKLKVGMMTFDPKGNLIKEG